jgi:hypothetical protein
MNAIPFAPARNRSVVQHAASIIAKSNNDWQETRDLRQQIEDRDRMIANLKRQLTLALQELAKNSTDRLTCAPERNTSAT